MITCASDIQGRRLPHEYFGLSTDEKPIKNTSGCNVINGSMFIEIDTKKVYLFDEENKRWIEQ